MDFEAIIAFLGVSYPVLKGIFSVLGLVVVVGQIIVALTPGKSDDAAAEKVFALPIIGPILKALALFAPIKK